MSTLIPQWLPGIDRWRHVNIQALRSTSCYYQTKNAAKHWCNFGISESFWSMQSPSPRPYHIGPYRLVDSGINVLCIWILILILYSYLMILLYYYSDYAVLLFRGDKASYHIIYSSIQWYEALLETGRKGTLVATYTKSVYSVVWQQSA